MKGNGKTEKRENERHGRKTHYFKQDEWNQHHEYHKERRKTRAIFHKLMNERTANARINEWMDG